MGAATWQFMEIAFLELTGALGGASISRLHLCTPNSNLLPATKQRRDEVGRYSKRRAGLNPGATPRSLEMPRLVLTTSRCVEGDCGSSVPSVRR